MGNWPQITYLILCLAGLLLSAHKHGREETKKGNLWHSIIASAIIFWLLWEGGFFKPLFE